MTGTTSEAMHEALGPHAEHYVIQPFPARITLARVALLVTPGLVPVNSGFGDMFEAHHRALLADMTADDLPPGLDRELLDLYRDTVTWTAPEVFGYTSFRATVLDCALTPDDEPPNITAFDNGALLRFAAALRLTILDRGDTAELSGFPRRRRSRKNA